MKEELLLLISMTSMYSLSVPSRAWNKVLLIEDQIVCQIASYQLSNSTASRRLTSSAWQCYIRDISLIPVIKEKVPFSLYISLWYTKLCLVYSLAMLSYTYLSSISMLYNISLRDMYTYVSYRYISIYLYTYRYIGMYSLYVVQRILIQH